MRLGAIAGRTLRVYCRASDWVDEREAHPSHKHVGAHQGVGQPGDIRGLKPRERLRVAQLAVISEGRRELWRAGTHSPEPG
jgi:hypothetical protein